MPTATVAATQFAELNIDTFLALSRIAFSSVEKLTALNLAFSRTSVESCLAAPRSILPAGGDQAAQLPALGELPAMGFQHAQDYARQLQAIATETRKEVSDLLASYQSQGGQDANTSTEWRNGLDMFKLFAQQITSMTEGSSRIADDAATSLRAGESSLSPN